MRNPVKIILDHLGIDQHELGLSTSVLYTHIDDGTWTYIVSVMRLVKAGDDYNHSLARYILHEVDDLWQWKLLDESTFSDAQLFDGRFDFIDDDNRTAGHITFDRSDDPAAEPTIEEDKEYPVM